MRSKLRMLHVHSLCLTFKQPMFTYADAHKKKTPIEIYSVSLNKAIYCVFKTHCIVSIVFFTKCLDGRLCTERNRSWYAAILVVVEGGLIRY